MSRDDYIHGDYNVICDYSGFKVKASECRMTWNGHFVLAKYWEPRHPQDFVRARTDRQSVTIARPDHDPVFITAPVLPDDL